MTRILIVEDSLLTSRMEQKYLQSAGYETKIAAKGMEAIEIAKKFKPDLIILDYILPDIDGLKILKMFLEKDPSTVVVMVTGQGDEHLATEVMKAGAKDYVIKTRDFLESLVHVVGRVLEQVETNRKLEIKNAQAERLTAQNELSFWVAQNFRNLFTGAIGFLELIDFSNEKQSEEKRLYFHGKALDTLYRASRLVDQLLNLTELSPQPPELLDFSRLVDLCIDSARQKVNQTPEFQIKRQDSEVGRIMINVSDAELVLENLLANAMESFDEPGVIEITSSLKPESILTIKIRDTGRGMPKEVLSKILTPMFTTKGGAGVGLGLSLVCSALRRHNGEIKIDSLPNKGTIVTVTWPLDNMEKPPAVGGPKGPPNPPLL